MSEPTKLLIVEDDADIRELIANYLGQSGFAVTACADAGAMDRALASPGFTPDLVILDLMLPGEDGLSICRRLRARTELPIVMLTARAEDVDRIVGLELGADDYLAKPFNPRELVARIRAILRRGMPRLPQRESIEVGRVRIDREGRRVSAPSGEEISLTSAEFDLLICFVDRPGRVLSRDQLMDWTRGREATPFDRTIDVQVSRLRKKLEDGDDVMIKTVRGQGYILTAPVRKVS